MKILAFNTANNFCSIAVSSNEKIITYRENLNNAMQAESLVPMIDQALRDAKIPYGDLDWLLVTNGPGSFTGIRIGLAAATGIALCTNIKTAAITNFELAYFRASEQVKGLNEIYIILNAYRNEVYVQKFSEINSEPEIININYLPEKFQNLNSPFVCAGDGIEAVYSLIQNIPGIIILPRFAKIKAYHLIKYFHAKGLFIPSPLHPLYLRPPDAKIPQNFSKF